MAVGVGSVGLYFSQIQEDDIFWITSSVSIYADADSQNEYLTYRVGFGEKHERWRSWSIEKAMIWNWSSVTNIQVIGNLLEI